MSLAPQTEYVLSVSGAFFGSIPNAQPNLAGTVGSGNYTLSAAGRNACGTGAVTAPITITVPLRVTPR